MPEKMSRMALYRSVWQTPFKILSNDLGLTETQLRKICIDMEIPVPRYGQLEAILRARSNYIPPLPDTYEGSNDVFFPCKGKFAYARAGKYVLDAAPNRGQDPGIRVSFAELHYARRIMKQLLRTAEQRGHVSFVNHKSAYLEVKGHTINVSVRERVNGCKRELYLRAGGYFLQEWTAEQGWLQRIDEVLLCLEQKASELNQYWREQRKERITTLS